MTVILGLVIAFVIYKIIKSLFFDEPTPPTQKTLARVELPTSPQNDRERNYREQYERPTETHAQWYEKGKNVRVRGCNIPGGLIYVGEKLPDLLGYGNDACLIDPRLKILPPESGDTDEELGYWPQYDRLSTRGRGLYLKWLAGNRSNPETDIGYVFLFFYGLERRLLIDGQKGKVSESERSDIINEILRLLEIFGKNNSFRGYSNNLLAMEWVLYQNNKPIPSYIDFNNRYCSEPFQVVLAQYVASGKPIPAEIALMWILLRPEFGLRTPARRCAKEFGELFTHRYRNKFGDGILIKPNQTPLKLEYHAASPSMQGALSLNMPNLPNPFILTSPLKKISALVEECTSELESYSRYMGKKDVEPNRLAALSLLPKELVHQNPGVKITIDQLAQLCATGPDLIAVDALYANLGGTTPSPLGRKELESLASLVEGMGFGMAPDIRFHNIKLMPDDKVAIFPNGHGSDFQPSKEFRIVGTMIRLAAMVCQSDKDLSPAEESTIQSLILENSGLNAAEKNSLMAFLHWCLRTPQGTAGLKQRLADVSPDGKTAISHILVSVAHADGSLDPREIKQLEKLYTTLGLDKDQVTKDLHVLATANEPVTVALRDKEESFSIPRSTAKESVTFKGFRLNEELIRIREEETRQVKGVLEGIFSDKVDDDVATDNAPATLASPNNPLVTLDETHMSFLHHLLTKETWDRASLYEICKARGLMIDGAMEVINEWAFKNANASLIDDGDPIFVDVNLAREIMNA